MVFLFPSPMLEGYASPSLMGCVLSSVLSHMVGGRLMPQGPAHLHHRFGDDWTAWTYLRRRGFTMSKGVVSPPWRGHRLSGGEADAIDYLFMEWDWGYEPFRAPREVVERSMLSTWGRWVLRVSSGPLRVRDKYLRSWQMWWYCVAKYELRRRWYYVTGRRKEWDEEQTIFSGDLFDEANKL